MTDEYIEFLTENAQRAYPLREDSVPSTTWANNIILDARGFSRDMPGGGIFLSAFSGYSVSSPTPPWINPTGYSSFFFTLGNTAIARVDVHSSQNLNLPFKAAAVFVDPNSSTPLAGIEITIGPGFASKLSTFIIFDKTAPLESSTIINLNRQQIDCIRIMHTDNSIESVEGDIVIRGGYSTEVLQSGNSLSISASVGAGELGQYEGYQQENSCAGYIYSISGANPNYTGNIKFIAGKGINIQSTLNTVTISLDTSGLLPSCS